ncbi:MAG: phosphomethylpyrimidine synthase ThiC [Candidatus Aminicenantes bacterium]|nr:phosphomethylpyrimidine synthase ThiC [Candidatus Aminicenantes bacterium]
MTQLESAKAGKITPQMKTVAQKESMEEEKLRLLVATGRVVIPANGNHKNLDPIGIGKFLRTKINANIGTSGDFDKIEDEFKKIDMVIKYQSDTVMDLSTGGDIDKIRRALIGRSTLPFGNVPIYQMVKDVMNRGKAFLELSVDEMFAYIEKQAEDGVDYMTIHAGLTRRAVEKVRKQKRKAGIVSRGGSIITAWMLHNNKENPFYEHFDRLLQVAGKYDVTLSLGDGLRPGSLADGSDWGQMEELLTLGELVKRSREAGVQVMVEGPGHLPMDQVEMNIKLQKTICDEAPFYVLGPVVTDIAPGYDHITSTVGGAIAGAAGADYLCYVTPTEHLGLPDEDDVKEGIIAARIAAHVADIAKGVPGAIERDHKMAEARSKLDWAEQEKLCIDPEKFRRVRAERSSETDACSMCGELCVYKILEDRF